MINRDDDSAVALSATLQIVSSQSLCYSHSSRDDDDEVKDEDERCRSVMRDHADCDNDDG